MRGFSTLVAFLCLIRNQHAIAVTAAADVNDLLVDLAAATSRLSTLQNVSFRLKNATTSLREKIVPQIQAVEKSHHELLSRRREVFDLIERFNRQQLQHLEKKLRAIQEMESKRKEAVKTAPPVGITNEQLEETLSEDALLLESDGSIRDWLISEMRKEADIFKTELLTNYTNQTNEVLSLAVASATAAVANSTLNLTCLSPAVAAQYVQDAVVNFSRDGIGRFDHAQQKAHIVYSMTSPTYRPPVKPQEQLGWWRDWIPEDWEKHLLPDGWQNWEIRVPDYLAHTFGWKDQTETVPPEMVLHPLSLPGSCWPMEGRNGHVVVQLVYPVKVDAVSIEHASSLLMDDTKENLKSAPKNIKVYGFHACDEDDSVCLSRGFDEKSRTLMATFIFDVALGGVQTFHVSYSAGRTDTEIALKKLGDGENDSETTLKELGDGTCSPSMETCSATMFNAGSVYSAVDFEILDNWGNLDYTCIYRVRVHGEAVFV